MSALPHPELPPGPHRELCDALHELHHLAGWPSLRTLARATGVSHTTVSKVFSTPALPSWGTLELLVDAMGGNATTVHELWLAASTPINGTHPMTLGIAGRHTELATVRRHLETGKGLLLVTGEAGIGKTKLVVTAAESTTTFNALGHCLALATEVPLMPIADALRAVHQCDQGEWLRKALGDCPSYVAASLSRLLPEIGDPTTPMDPDDEWSRQRLFFAIAAVFDALGGHRRLALVLDDLHWADPMTLDLIEHLTAQRSALPVLGTWRIEPGTRPAAADWWGRIRRAPSVTVLPLGPLSHDETADQLRLLGENDSATIDRIHARSLGQPLFTEQLAAHGSAPDADLPDLLADVLDRRFDHLPRPCWTLARILAVADRGLPVEVLAVCAGFDVDDLAAALTELRERMLLASVSDAVVQLRHPLLGTAVRRRLLAPETAQVHHQIARALVDHPQASAAEVAAHWRAAGELTRELEWRIRAAQTADERFAGDEAAYHWTRVLELWPAGAAAVGSPPVSKARALAAAMDGHDIAGHHAKGRALGTTVSAEVSQWPAPDTAEYLRRMACYADTLDHIGAGSDMYAEALALFRRLPVSEGLIHTLDQVANLYNQCGKSEAAGALLDEALQDLEALETVRAKGQPAKPSALRRGLLATIAWQDTRHGHLERALARIAEVARMDTVTPEPLRDIWVGVLHTDILLLACAAPEQVAAAGRRGLDAAATWRIETVGANTLRYNVASAWARSGHIRHAAGLVDPATDGAIAANSWSLHLLRAVLDGARGLSQAAEYRFDSLARAEGVDPGILATERAAFALWHQRPDEALEAIEHAYLDATASSGLMGEIGVPLVLAARAAADMAQSRPAEGIERRGLFSRVQALRESVDHDPFSPQSLPSDRCAAAQWSAEMSRLKGTETVELWLRAASEWEGVNRAHDSAYCRWRAAQVALRGGQGTVAARLLKRAATDAREHVPLSQTIARTDLPA